MASLGTGDGKMEAKTLMAKSSHQEKKKKTINKSRLKENLNDKKRTSSPTKANHG